MTAQNSNQAQNIKFEDLEQNIYISLCQPKQPAEYLREAITADPSSVKTDILKQWQTDIYEYSETLKNERNETADAYEELKNMMDEEANRPEFERIEREMEEYSADIALYEYDILQYEGRCREITAEIMDRMSPYDIELLKKMQ